MTSPFNPSALIRLRSTMHFSQAELGRRIGVAAWTVASWERGRQQPTAKRLPPLAAALNCEVIDLLEAGPVTPRVLRYQAGLSIARLAELSKVPRTTVADVDEGLFMPTQAAALAAVLGVTVEEFQAACTHRQHQHDERDK